MRQTMSTYPTRPSRSRTCQRHPKTDPEAIGIGVLSVGRPKRGCVPGGSLRARAAEQVRGNIAGTLLAYVELHGRHLFFEPCPHRTDCRRFCGVSRAPMAHRGVGGARALAEAERPAGWHYRRGATEPGPETWRCHDTTASSGDEAVSAIGLQVPSTRARHWPRSAARSQPRSAARSQPRSPWAPSAAWGARPAAPSTSTTGRRPPCRSCQGRYRSRPGLVRRPDRLWRSPRAAR